MQTSSEYEIFDGYATVGDYVFGEIRRMIVNWDLKPGQRISETEMSKTLNVSRQPVREAFIRLKNEGLVVVLPQRGTFVTKINVEKVQEGLFIRNCLEKEIIKLLSGRLSEDMIKRSKRLIEKQSEALAEKDAKKFYNNDVLFHKSFFEAADRRITWEVISYSNTQSERVSMLTLLDFERFDSVFEVHSNLLQAIIDNKPDEAIRISSDSIQRLVEEVAFLKEKHQEYFE